MYRSTFWNLATFLKKDTIFFEFSLLCIIYWSNLQCFISFFDENMSDCRHVLRTSLSQKVVFALGREKRFLADNYSLEKKGTYLFLRLRIDSLLKPSLYLNFLIAASDRLAQTDWIAQQQWIGQHDVFLRNPAWCRAREKVEKNRGAVNRILGKIDGIEEVKIDMEGQKVQTIVFSQQTRLSFLSASALPCIRNFFHLVARII